MLYPRLRERLEESDEVRFYYLSPNTTGNRKLCSKDPGIYYFIKCFLLLSKSQKCPVTPLGRWGTYHSASRRTRALRFKKHR